MANPQDKLTYRQLVNYGVMTVPLAVAGLPMLIFVPAYFAQDIGLEIGLLGIVLMMSRMFDMASDPVIGMVSDRIHTPFGRRKPWIVIGITMMSVATWKLFLASAAITLGWLAVWLVIFYLGWTLIAVPYTAWGVELTDDYHERTRVAGVREIFSIIGMILVFVGAGVVTEDIEPGVSETSLIIEAMGWMTLFLLPLCGAFLLFNVRERKLSQSVGRSFAETLADLLHNKPFVLLIAAAFITELGVAINNSVLVIFYDNVVGLQERVDELLGIYFAAALLGIPLWLWFARVFDKHKAVCIAALWNAGSLFMLPFIQTGDFASYAAIEFSRGIAFAGPLVLGASMIADVVEYDSWRHGESRAGFLTAFWITGSKLASAIGVGIALPALGWLGFNALQESHQDVREGITLIYAVIPGILALCAIPLVWNYPLTSQKNATVKRALAKRNKREEPLLTIPY
ncbi:MFS transporter [Maricurvus nonylphenolicus]|uniref:MFS transporter n=1 Tax=Maricurvus nonylphenolicus TaxID=1008307 RepID=UPI0036F3343C